MAKATADTITGTEVLEAPLKKEVDSISKDETLQAPREGNVTDSNGNAFLPITKTENRIFILSNDKRRGTVQLDVEEDVIDPATGKTRRMRLLRGAQSIWFDEQPPTVFPQKYVEKNILTLDFNKGICIIPLRDKLKLKAAELTNRNVATKNKLGDLAIPKDIYFYEWNPVELNQKALSDQNDIIKAMQLAATVPMAEMVAHANYLAIPFVDEMGVPLTEETLRTAYSIKAMTNAKQFLSSIHSPTVKIAYMVRKAIDLGKIDLGKQPGAAYWVDGGFISAVPQGRDAVDFLIEFAGTPGEANVAFQNQLRELT
jgi:hypothetical protein